MLLDPRAKSELNGKHLGKLFVDYLVQPYPNQRPDVLLGRWYVNPLGITIRGGFFVLERVGRVEYLP